MVRLESGTWPDVLRKVLELQLHQLSIKFAPVHDGWCRDGEPVFRLSETQHDIEGDDGGEHCYSINDATAQADGSVAVRLMLDRLIEETKRWT